MPDRTTQTETDFAALARRDAQRIAPGFSELLHRRVLRALEQVDGPRLQIRPAVWNQRRSYWAGPLKLAAVVALVAAPAIILLRPDVPRVSQLPVKKLKAVSTASSTAGTPHLAVYATAREVNLRVEDVVQTAMAEEQFAGLDHDVRSATRYLVDQVPLRSVWEPPRETGER